MIWSDRCVLVGLLVCLLVWSSSPGLSGVTSIAWMEAGVQPRTDLELVRVWPMPRVASQQHKMKS